MLFGRGPGTVLRVLYTLGGYRPCRMNPAPLAQFRIERSPGGLSVVGASRFPAATGTCVTMGDRVRHTARLECRDERRYQRKPRKMVKTQAALRQGLKAAPDPTHRPHDDVDEEPSNGDDSQG